jgi:type II secretory pathway component PulF
MTAFTYKALDKYGKNKSGVIDAESPEHARELLTARGLVPKQIDKRQTEPFSMNRLMLKLTPVRADELVLFTKQLGTMLRVGVPILRTLEIMEKQAENPRLKATAAAMAADIRDGSSLSGAIKRHRKIFSPLYFSMVEAGETGGVVPEVLDRLIYVMQHDNKVKADIQAAMLYPAIVLTFLTVAFLGLTIFIIPQFGRIFATADITLPLATRICLKLNQLLTTYWMQTTGIVAVLIILLGSFLRTDKGRYIRDNTMIHLPVIGKILVKSAISRFASIFSILQASGVAVLDAVHVLAGAIGNSAMADQLRKAIPLLEEGRGLSKPLQSVKAFTPMLINMVAIGEESGRLDQMLRDVSEHYDSEVEYAMKRLSTMVGPVLILMLAILVGFFALAVLLPVWDLSKIVR